MPSRADQLCVPEGRWERAAWLDEHFDRLLAGVALDPGGWAGVARLEGTLFPKAVSDYLGGRLDPACPECGMECDEGTVERVGPVFRVDYGCHAFEMTEEQLRSRVRHAGHG